MTESLKIVRINPRKNKREQTSYNWKKHLNAFELGRTSIVPAAAFSQSLLRDFNEMIKPGIRVEVRLHDYDANTNGVETRWFGIIEKVAGLRVLVEWLGCTSKVWLHSLTDDIHFVGSCAKMDSNELKCAYVPPVSMDPAFRSDLPGFIAVSIIFIKETTQNNAKLQQCVDTAVVGGRGLTKQYEKHRKSIFKTKFRVGQRLELLNYNLSTELRVARIKEMVGRRMNVLVTEEDYPGDLPDDEDRQLANNKDQYWIDQDSFFVFPVGFAAVNGYKIVANKEYLSHTKKIAHAMANGKTPRYHPDDISFEDAERDVPPGEFHDLVVSSILDFCVTDGYFIVGMDGPDAKSDSFPMHINNLFMFPVGYAEKYRLKLTKPEGFKGKFVWDKYLEAEKAEPIPFDAFKPMPSKDRLKMFQVGSHLEAADMCENQFICPATIKSVHGRLVNVHFDGWDSAFDELYDIDSHDILPIGWCELHNYELQEPKKSN
uniref:Mbt repeat protein n=1 Tax=Caenorhabditis tropicalis TaxID=1561998 RepID=A0A1I7TLG2_9PELO